MHRIALRLLIAALAAVALTAALGAPANAATREYKVRSQPFRMSGFQTILPKVWVKAPGRDGYITKFNAHLVYGNGRRVSIRRVMLHHIVFLNAGYPGKPPERTTCPGRKGQAFWGTGEERQRLILPKGYGYAVNRRDRWRMQAMLMSHSIKAQRLRVEYTYTMVTGRRMQRVRPLWLRANGCTTHPSYGVPGNGREGSVHEKSFDWRMPLNGRIVAAGAHVHGGNIAMDINQQRCDGRRIIRHLPTYGRPDDLVYRLRPILHEPGPIGTGYFMSRRGIPVRRGERLRVTGFYDGEFPRSGVMAITHVYVAVDDRAPKGCAPLPSDRFYHYDRRDGRPKAPRMAIPFNAWSERRQRVVEVRRPAGRLVEATDRATVKVLDNRFAPANLLVDRDARITWTWLGREPHNIYYADGPLNISTGTKGRGFRTSKVVSEPGTYRMFCWLHPLTMHQQIDVKNPADVGA